MLPLLVTVVGSSIVSNSSNSVGGTWGSPDPRVPNPGGGGGVRYPGGAWILGYRWILAPTLYRRIPDTFGYTCMQIQQYVHTDTSSVSAIPEPIPAPLGTDWGPAVSNGGYCTSTVVQMATPEHRRGLSDPVGRRDRPGLGVNGPRGRPRSLRRRAIFRLSRPPPGA